MNNLSRIKIDDNKSKNLLKVLLLSIAFYFILYNFTAVWKFLGFFVGILSPFILGGALAFIIKIPMNFIENKILKNMKSQKKKRGLSIFLSILTIILLLVLLVVIVVPQFIKSIQNLEDKLPIFTNKAFEFLNSIPGIGKYSADFQKTYSNFSWDKAFLNIKDFLFNENSRVFSKAMSTASNIFGAFVNFFVGFIFSIYILFDKEKLSIQSKRLIFSMFKENTANYINKVFKLAHHFFYSFIKGQFTDAVVLGVIVFIGMSILRLPYAPMIAILTSFLALVPIVGALLSALIGFIILLIESPTQAIVFIVFMIIAQQVEGNIIYPKIVGSSLSLPSMWTLFAVTVGGSLLGIVGMWLFVPIFAIIYTLLGEYVENQLQEKNIKIE